jgi:hypothetical protein
MRSFRDATTGHDNGGLPRWMKLSAIIVAILVLLGVAMMLLFGGGPGGHGPRRHALSGGAAGQTPSSGVAANHAPPEGSHA